MGGYRAPQLNNNHAVVVLLRSVELAGRYNCCAFLESNAESLINRDVEHGITIGPCECRNLSVYAKKPPKLVFI
jgi:hypothetical protein